LIRHICHIHVHDDFDPEQKRDKSGRWNAGGGYKLRRNKAAEERLTEGVKQFGTLKPGVRELVYFDITEGLRNRRAGHILATIHKKLQRLEIGYVEGDLGSNSIGPAAVRSLLKQLRQHFPDLKTVSGERISGARQLGSKKNSAAEIRLPSRTTVKVA
jgi:hypothetical protein